MKKYIKNILIIIAAILTTNIASAQEGRPQEPPQLPNDEQIEDMLVDLAKTLKLTDVQEEQVSDLYFAHFEKVADQQEQNKGKREESREAMEKLNKELEDGVNALLTEGQQNIYKTYLENQKSQRGKKDKPQGKKPR